MVQVGMDSSILDAVRDSLGLNELDTSFDTEIIFHINSALAELYQAGVGNSIMVSDNTTKWSDFLGKDPSGDLQLMGSLQLYVFLSVKILFDPPAPGTQNVMEQKLKELIWRFQVAYDKYKLTEVSKDGSIYGRNQERFNFGPRAPWGERYEVGSTERYIEESTKEVSSESGGESLNSARESLEKDIP